jgi:hypothetical protein
MLGNTTLDLVLSRALPSSEVRNIHGVGRDDAFSIELPRYL